MSRIANSPITLPNGVDIKIDGNSVNVKGQKGVLEFNLHSSVEIKQEEKNLLFKARHGDKGSRAMAGTMRSLVNNMVIGVSDGFQKRLTLIGVGYRAKAQGSKLSLSLGFSHPVEYQVPDSITIETPSQTEIVIKGVDKQLVGQVAANIRAYRPPEPYKGKGVRYFDEQISLKEAKKK
ncbi:LSU ribosomal protein L6p (L9e) [hydrothermal vent metagenome]|uniref:LSU ribosomal protein L6p (L9e) n=1 Tax=hydrothermal vent metagenome TaxID=652676 RepID=A0A3B0Y8B4_9ZZZZ